jgi:hypothetical protein
MRGTLDVKWQYSWNSVSCQVPRSNVCRGLWQSGTFRMRIAKNRITVAWIATDRSRNLRADCHRLDFTSATWEQNLAMRSPLESGLPRSYSCCGNPRHLTAELSKWPNSSTHHWQFHCLLRHKFLTHDFLGVRKIRSGLFTPKLYTTGLCWQTISWYYPFKLQYLYVALFLCSTLLSPGI